MNHRASSKKRKLSTSILLNVGYVLAFYAFLCLVNFIILSRIQRVWEPNIIKRKSQNVYYGDFAYNDSGHGGLIGIDKELYFIEYIVNDDSREAKLFKRLQPYIFWPNLGGRLRVIGSVRVEGPKAYLTMEKWYLRSPFIECVVCEEDGFSDNFEIVRWNLSREDFVTDNPSAPIDFDFDPKNHTRFDFPQ